MNYLKKQRQKTIYNTRNHVKNTIVLLLLSIFPIMNDFALNVVDTEDRISSSIMTENHPDNAYINFCIKNK